VNLEAKIAASLPLPAGKTDHIEWDDDLFGFGLRLRQSGGKLLRSWVVQYRSKGRTRRSTIAAVGKVSAAEARKAAQRILSKVALGGDPQADKAAERLKAAGTLRAVIES
jgi:hypothetical protein